MYILVQHPGDTMVLDTTRGHRATHEKLLAFLASPQASMELESSLHCPAYPEAETLRRLRMVKTPGLILTQHLPEAVLQVSGRPELLERYIQVFLFDDAEGGGTAILSSSSGANSIVART